MKTKSFFAFLLSAALVGGSLTACSDDDDDAEPDVYTFNATDNLDIELSQVSQVSSKPGGPNSYYLTASVQGMGLTSLLSNQAIDLYCYSYSTAAMMGTVDATTNAYIKNADWQKTLFLGNEEATGFVGGFCPIGADVFSEYEYYKPMSGGTETCFVVNGGSYLKAFFSKHFGKDMNTLASLKNGKFIESIDVCLPDIYSGLVDSTSWEIDYSDVMGNPVGQIPANSKIVTYVRGRIHSLKVDVTELNSIAKTLEQIKNLAKGMAGSFTDDNEIKEVEIVLATTDKDGKVTLNEELKNWKTIDLSSLNKSYLFEIQTTVVGADGKELQNYSLPEDLNNILVKNIKFSDK